MSARDPVAVILAGLDRRVAPRPEFADALLARLLEELSQSEAPTGRPWLTTIRLPRVLPGAPARLRFALIVIAVLMLLAGIATATYFGVRTWLSAGPRGPQFTSDFQLAEIFRDDRHFYADFKLSPDGRALYALRSLPNETEQTVLVRLSALHEAKAEADEVLEFGELVSPELWDPGVDLSEAVIGTTLSQSGNDVLAVAENGDIFVVAAAQRPETVRDPAAPAVAVSLLVVRPDGSRQRVLTLRELLAARLLTSGKGDYVTLRVAASAPDRLWVRADVFSKRQTISGRVSFFQVHDPTRDGDWSDRTVLPLMLPARLANLTGEPAPFTQMVVEPSTGSDDRSGSFLLPVLASGKYRVYRVSDSNHDGDARDEGELELVFSAIPPGGDARPPMLASRVVVRNGSVALREFVASSLTRTSRVSRISQSGDIFDIARSFNIGSGFEDVAAGREGNIYVVGRLPATDETRPNLVVYRLSPVGEVTASAATPPTAVATGTEPSPAAPPGVARIAFALEKYEADTGEIFVVRADGAGLHKLVPGKHNHAFCQSADGSRMVYASDAEAPRELFLYVADADGTNRRKISERQAGFVCPFSGRALPLIVGDRGTTVIRHDLTSGRERTLVTGAERLAMSPDGRQLLFVGGLDFGKLPPRGAESLELVNVDTGARRRLGGPRTGQSYTGAKWSNDGARIAYFVGPSPYPEPKSGRYDLYVRDPSAGEANLVAQVRGGPPSVFWSSGGTQLLVCAPAHGTQIGCTGGDIRGRAPRARLLRIDLATGRTNLVAKGHLVFAGWAPGEDAFAYADERAAFFASVDGEVHLLVRAPKGGWPVGEWLGWSPDGRYIGLGWFSKRLAVLDVASDRVRVLREEKKGGFFMYRAWWR